MALAHAAAARGVATSYRASGGQQVTVAPETIEAVLAALGEPPEAAATPEPGTRIPVSVTASAPAAQAFGTSQEPGRPATRDGRSPGAGLPVAPRPRRRGWGFAVQLYALRSLRSWGHGDFGDLADFAAWSGAELGASFVLVNPLCAVEPLPPLTASPYLPASRRFLSPLYLRVEDVSEYARLDAAQRHRIAELSAPLRGVGNAVGGSGTGGSPGAGDDNPAAELIDRDAVWTAKRDALQILHRVPLDPARRADYERFRRAQGDALADWAAWCAFAEVHGPDWRTWPSDLGRPDSAAATAERRRLRPSVEFHSWLQWLIDGQFAAAQRTARDAGMDVGIVHDLPVGSAPGGGEAWTNQDVLVSGVMVGAPPDEFNPRGQRWGSRPWHPQRLAARDYRPLVDLVAGAARYCGALRMDHVMGLARLWWVPDGMTADRGTYVCYDVEATVGVLAGTAARAGMLAIGEDLGTVEPWLRELLAACGVLGTSVLWFERRDDGTPRPPGEWRADCLATVGTHDMPTAAAFLTGQHVALRARLGVLTRPVAVEQADADRAVTGWRTALTRAGLLPAGTEATPADRTADPATSTEHVAALYAYVARTPAMLVSVELTDAVGQLRPQNIPGTTDEYPNWRVPLLDDAARPVLLEELREHPTVRAVTDAVRRQLK